MEPTRIAGLAQLQAFTPRAKDYAAKRNFDLPGHPHVSLLSAYVSCRLISEQEILAHVLKNHSIPCVENFMQEVCWRTYWKGWLEMRPGVWKAYRSDLQSLAFDETQIRRAEQGQTGIECFDHWCRELIETGYLHNHARMWFASIWIFTLQLPWQLGADFFFRHLLDGDAASNTLSWRWVAGLQTAGKTYLARAENIQRFTAGRFNPAGCLNESGPDLPPIPQTPKPDSSLFSDLPCEIAESSGIRRGLLILGDDLCLETSVLGGATFDSIAAGWDAKLQDEYAFSPQVLEFKSGAVADSLQRAANHWSLPSAAICDLQSDRWADSVEAWSLDQELEQIICLHPGIGPWSESLSRLRSQLPPTVHILEVIRHWDAAFWPHATKGFFPFREKIPNVLKELI
jgi:deoxyribodipyrimidine photo-lyase